MIYLDDESWSLIFEIDKRMKKKIIEFLEKQCS